MNIAVLKNNGKERVVYFESKEINDKNKFVIFRKACIITCKENGQNLNEFEVFTNKEYAKKQIKEATKISICVSKEEIKLETTLK